MLGYGSMVRLRLLSGSRGTNPGNGSLVSPIRFDDER